jgi:hypothetical protein
MVGEKDILVLSFSPTISLLSMKTVSYKQQAVGSDILMPTPRRSQKEGLGTGNLLDHFELIGMIDDVGVVQLENITVLHLNASCPASSF